MRKNKTILKCVYCEKDFLVHSSRLNRGQVKFCSRRCYGDSKKGKIVFSIRTLPNEELFLYKQKMSNVMKDRIFTEEHKNNLKGHVPWNRGKTYNILRKKENKSFLGRKHSKESILKISTSQKLRYANGAKNPMLSKKRVDILGDKNPSKKLINREKISSRMKNGGAIKAKLGNIIHSINRPEKKVLSLLMNKYPDFIYTGNGKMWFKGINHYFNPDFISKQRRLIIEVFGNYWHNLEEKKLLDEERFITYSKSGFKSLIIWENDLKNVNNVINNITSFIEEDLS